jgi:hypothetical protein
MVLLSIVSVCPKTIEKGINIATVAMMEITILFFIELIVDCKCNTKI